MKKKIVIFGGSFSPPHIGHASVIEAILRLVKCDEIWIMPSADRRDKKITAPGNDRLRMCQLMIEELFSTPTVPILISTEELSQKQLTTTYHTKLMLENKHPDFEFYFVIGADLIKDIENLWVDGKKLWQEANFITIKGPHYTMPDRLPPKILIIDEFGWSSTSSTFIRNLISKGFSGIPYISKNVAFYIKEKGNYL